jgi:VIT1/CCC1 family predicted Fe2+/Mn2+ transporter
LQEAVDPSSPSGARRRLEELNNDLRVALPGVQVLFGFLLTLPFSARFTELNAGAERVAYLVAFISAAISSVFLIAPSALHRFYHELDDPGGLVSLFRISAQLAVAGTLCLAISMGAVVFLVVDVFYHRAAAALVTSLIAVLIAWFWFGYPISRRFNDKPERSP